MSLSFNPDFLAAYTPQKAGLISREIWKNVADKKFFQDFRTIHWRYLSDIAYLLGSPSYETEICCAAYKKHPFYCDFIGGVGVEVNGDIKLAGNGDLGSMTLHHNNKSIKVPTAYDRLIFNQSDSENPYEFIVSNWKPVALYLDRERFEQELPADTSFKSALHQVCALSLKTNLPVYDPFGQVIYR